LTWLGILLNDNSNTHIPIEPGKDQAAEDLEARIRDEKAGRGARNKDGGTGSSGPPQDSTPTPDHPRAGQSNKGPGSVEGKGGGGGRGGEVGGRAGPVERFPSLRGRVFRGLGR